MAPKPKRDPVKSKRGAKPKREASMTRRELAAVRYGAETFYTNDVIGNISLREMVDLPQFKDIKLSTLDSWAKEDRWMSQRREKQARIKQGLEERLGMQLIQSQMKQMNEFQEVYDRARLFLMSKEGPAPRSFEQLATVMLKIADRMDLTRSRIIDQISPPAADEAEDESQSQEKRRVIPDQMLPNLNQDAALAAAHAVMEQRRAAAALEAPKTVDATEPLGGADGEAVDP